MLYIIEPRTESDKVEAVGSPDVPHSYAYGENMVTYYGLEESQSIQSGSLVNCNGIMSVVVNVSPMKFGRVLLTVVPADPISRTTTGALIR
jgi:hypothetical protein